MGVSAYNRGSRLIRAQLDATATSREREFMNDLNAYPKHPKASTPFTDVLIRHDPHRNLWWVLDPSKGWAGWGFYYKSLWNLMADWKITIVAYNIPKKEFIATPSTQNLPRKVVAQK